MGLIDGVINLGTSIAGMVTSKKQQKSQNEFNAEQAQLNRDFQEKMLQKQQDYATDMWNKTNEYNSASAQRERYEAAGFNPYMMMGGVNAGVAQSASPGSTPSGSTAQAAGGIDVAGNMVKAGIAASDIMNSIKQRKMLDKQMESVDADTRLKDIDAKTRDQRNNAELAMLMEQKGYLSKKAAQAIIENQFLPEKMAADIQGTKANIKRQEAAAKLDSISAMMKSTELQFLPSRLRYDILTKAAQIDLFKADVKQIEKSIDKIVFDMKPEIEKITGKKLKDDEAFALKRALLDMKSAEADAAQSNRSPNNLWQALGDIRERWFR